MRAGDAQPNARPRNAARQTEVLLAKYLADTVKNPAALVSCLLPFFLLFIIELMWRDFGGSSIGEELHLTSLLTFALTFEAAMASSMVVLYAMAEEREKGVLRTLVLADVHVGSMLVARGAAAEIVIAATLGATYLAFGAPPAGLAPFLLITVVGSLPLMLCSLLLGMVARTQMEVMVLDTPLIIAAIVPMLLVNSEILEPVILLMPTGGMFELAWLLMEGSLFTAEAVAPAISLAVWMAATAAALVVLRKRFARGWDA